MYLLVSALILALLAPAAAGERSEPGPTCRAELQGLELRTRVDLPSGVRVEGPWQIVYRGDRSGGETTWIMFATLDRIMETDALTGESSTIPLPEPVQLAFEGSSQEELVQRAARTWCVTVMRAQRNNAFNQLTPYDHQHRTRITVAPAPSAHAS